jgi:PAS domain S-box-containing protein/diguanylate cyclase (GGDEF)-like protein
VGYDPALTLASLLAAVLAAGIVLAVAGGRTLRPAALLAGAALAGLCAWTMHYLGMAAMQMVPPLHYEPLATLATLLIAIAAAAAGLWLGFTLRARALPYKALGALMLGLALTAMHYSGLASAHFARDSVSIASIPLQPDNSYLGQGIGMLALVILTLTLLASSLDERLGTRTARMLARLRESEERYRVLLDTITDAVLLVDEAGTIAFANPGAASVFGHGAQELLGQPFWMLQPERLRPPPGQGFRQYLESGAGGSLELQGLRRDGGEFPLEAAFSEVSLEGRRLFAGFLRDISERKEREARIARLNRVQAVLSGINSLIVGARNRQTLFDQACRIAVEQGGFRMAMIGMVAGDEVRPVAVYGNDEGYVRDNVHISLDERDPLGQGPTAAAMREKRVRVCNDIASDPAMAPWRDAALVRGFRASVTYPLLEGEQLAGCMSLYAAEVGAFDEQELKLLAELAGDISHALDFIARDEQLDYLAYYDPLTRLANRKLFVQRLGHYLDGARLSRGCVALLKLDLARFTSINEAVGRDGGDAVLREVADRIVGFAGNPGRVARMQGDRFALVFADLKQASDLTPQQLQPLWQALAAPVAVAGRELHVTVRSGIAVFPQDGDDADALLHNAEAALKMARAENEPWLFYTRQMGSRIGEKRALEEQLRQAFKRKEFTLHYQPKVALGTGAICGAEALIRWNSPDLGTVPAAHFVPLLEETGMILEVGRWALQRAAADLREWERQGLRAPRVAVNLSPLQLRQPGFVEELRAAVSGPDGRPAALDLEITESVLMTDIEQHIGKLVAARELGMGIAIDDFGTGYSSLAYLNRLPIAAIKIDRSFVVQMTDSADTMNIVSTIISLAHSLGLRAIAEGVDSAEQLRFLRLLRCDEMQGFLFSKGLPAAEFAQLLREERRLA